MSDTMHHDATQNTRDAERASPSELPTPTTATPLRGWRIVITRAEEQADSLAERLRSLGAEPLAYPTIAFAPPEDVRPLDEALRRIPTGAYTWLMLTSVNAVNAVQQRIHSFGQEPRAFLADHCKVAAVGPTTTTACNELLGMQPAIVPKKFVAEALAEAMGDMRGQRALLANADIARPVLQQKLSEAGAEVERVVAYRTIPATGGVDLPPLLAAGTVHAITFTSGSTARYFVERIGQATLDAARQTIIACIGPIAADAAREAGLPPTLVASTYTEQGLVEALVQYAQQKGATCE